MTGSAIVASGLRKVYQGQVVLDGVDLDVVRGSVFCLVGAGGAGKTTVVGLLAALLVADGGSALVAGFDVSSEGEEVRGAVGVVGRVASVDLLLSGRENLRVVAGLHCLGGEGEVEAVVSGVLGRVGLEGAADRLVSTYSGVMRFKLDLAMVLVRRPRVVFLDEPTVGLDSLGCRSVWGIVRELAADGVTVFFATRYLLEAEQVADRIAVLDQGKVVVEGTPRQLRRLVPGGYVQFRFADVARLRAAARVLAGGTPDLEGLVLRVPCDGGVRSVRGLLERLGEYAVEVEEFTVHISDLDDVFLALTGRFSV
jgi:ABC-2 type transport system ATP-binding protein